MKLILLLILAAQNARAELRVHDKTRALAAERGLTAEQLAEIVSLRNGLLDSPQGSKDACIALLRWIRPGDSPEWAISLFGEPYHRTGVTWLYYLYHSYVLEIRFKDGRYASYAISSIQCLGRLPDYPEMPLPAGAQACVDHFLSALKARDTEELVGLMVSAEDRHAVTRREVHSFLNKHFPAGRVAFLAAGKTQARRARVPREPLRCWFSVYTRFENPAAVAVTELRLVERGKSWLVLCTPSHVYEGRDKKGEDNQAAALNGG